MADNVNIIVQDTINDIVVNAAVVVETIDINVQAAVDVVDIVANPNNYVVNINRIIGEQVQSDWTQTDNQAPDYIKNKPAIPTNTSDLTNDGEDGINPFITAADVTPQVNSDWDATSGVAEILNKPTIPSIAGLATVTYVDTQDALKVDKVSGKGLSTNDYTTSEKNKLAGIEAGAQVNVNADWNAVSGNAQILNKPTLATVATSGSYTDLSNKPTIPAAQVNSDWNATTGVAQILNKPTIPAGGLPAGGTAGQILTKVDATDYNATWQENFADWTSVVKHTVKNNGLSGTITKGTAVYVTSSNGTNMLVGRASNASEATSSKTMGLMQSDITTTGGNQTGFVITEGLLEGLNTAAATAGDPVWLGVNGALIYGLANKPYAPAHLVFIGIVTKVSAGNGEIFVKVQNGFELKEIHDVDLITTTPINGHLLGFDGTLWINKTIASWLGFTPVTDARTISTTAPLSGGGDLSANRTLSITQATTSTNGYLSSTDWNTFNNKFTLPVLTSGSVLFSNGTTIAQNNSNFFWDNTNNRLGIGTATPTVPFDLRGNQLITFADVANRDSGPFAFSLTNGTFSRFNTVYDASVSRVNIFGTSTQGLRIEGGSSNSLTSMGGGGMTISALGNNFSISAGTFILNTGGSERMRVFSSTGNISVNSTTDAGYRLDVNGTARVSGNFTQNGSSLVSTTSGYWQFANSGNSTTFGSFISQQGLSYTGTQPVCINVASGSHNASATFQIDSTTKGFLPPRMTTTQKNAIATPAAGLMVYDTTLNLMALYNGTIWTTL